MSNVQPVYPNAILSWTDRVDGVSLDLAEDINTVASDLISVETTLGTNAQKEPNPPTGTAITYSNVSARISDAVNNINMPVSALSAASGIVPNGPAQNINYYFVGYDPYSMYNGTDITIPANGWWVVSSQQFWPWVNNGYTRNFMTLNGVSNVIDENLIDWQFSGNVLIANSVGTPRWQLFGKRGRWSKLWFQGPLHSGDRISVWSENGTASGVLNISNMSLKAAMSKKITGTFTSG